MADEQPDPLVSLLDKSGLSTAQKRGLWDLYTTAKDTSDLQKRLDSLQLPNAVKHQLWNLKDSEGETRSEDLRKDGTPKGGGFFGTLQRPDGRVSTELSIGVDFDGKETEIPLLVPSLSKQEVSTLLSLGDKDKIPDAIADKAVAYAKLRLAAGKSPFAEPGEVGKFTPLPFAYNPNRERKDTNVVAFGLGSQSDQPDTFGVPPELALPIGTAALETGLNAAGRAAAATKAAAGVAGPVIGNEVVRHTLRYAGLPEPFASIAADIFTARGLAKRGGVAATPAAEAAAAEATPLGFPKTTTAELSPLEMTRKLRAEHQAASGMTKLPSPEEARREFKLLFSPAKATGAARTKFTADEVAYGMRRLAKGAKAENVEREILSLRQLAVKYGLPNDAEMEALVKKANEAGRMTR